jgi:hypothetical protein
MAPTAVYLDVGAKRTFAIALAWPGWARSGRDEETALEALAEYAGRYRPVVTAAGVRFPKTAASGFEVTERRKGGGVVDFGALAGPIGADAEGSFTKAEAERLAKIVEASWAALDRAASKAPKSLRKGPRGGGRDRDAIVAHVADAEDAYVRRVGLGRRDRGDTPVREAFLDALRAARSPVPDGVTKPWPWRYAARRIAWHALDHAWEIEDRSER